MFPPERLLGQGFARGRLDLELVDQLIRVAGDIPQIQETARENGYF